MREEAPVPDAKPWAGSETSGSIAALDRFLGTVRQIAITMMARQRRKIAHQFFW